MRVLLPAQPLTATCTCTNHAPPAPPAPLALLALCFCYGSPLLFCSVLFCFILLCFVGCQLRSSSAVCLYIQLHMSSYTCRVPIAHNDAAAKPIGCSPCNCNCNCSFPPHTNETHSTATSSSGNSWQSCCCRRLATAHLCHW